MKLGSDFATTPMGTEAVRVAALRATGCVCDPKFLDLEVADLRCPVHGLAAFLAETLEKPEVRA